MIENPSKIKYKQWVTHHTERQVELIDMMDCGLYEGKWLLFYNKKIIDEIWSFLKHLYDNDELYGINSMKVSTNMKCVRASKTKDAVIVLYCFGQRDEVISIGKNLQSKIGTYGSSCIYYKTNQQTKEGTRGTGLNMNHSIKIENNNLRMLRDD